MPDALSPPATDDADTDTVEEVRCDPFPSRTDPASMNLIVESSSGDLAGAVAAELASFGSVPVRVGSPTTVELLHRPGVDFDALRAVLQPLQPTVRAVADLEADAILRLGDDQPLSAWNVRIECDSDDFAR